MLLIRTARPFLKVLVFLSPIGLKKIIYSPKSKFFPYCHSEEGLNNKDRVVSHESAPIYLKCLGGISSHHQNDLAKAVLGPVVQN